MTWFRFTARGVEPDKIPDILAALGRAGFRSATFHTFCSEEGEFAAGDLTVEFTTNDLAEFAEKLNALMRIFRGYTLALKTKDAVFLEGEMPSEETEGR